MLDESWDSQSYEFPKKSGSKKGTTAAGNKGSKLTTLDAKFPPTTPLKNMKKTTSSDSIDALFSPANSASDSGTPAGKKNTSFTFDDSVGNTPAKDTHDYLSNFAANSTELEDSILGELLGGPKKALKPPSSGHPASTKSTRAQHRLEPLESEEKKSTHASSSSSSLKNAPSLSRPSKGKPAVDLDRSADFNESTDRLFDDDKLPVSPPTQHHQHPPIQHQQSKSLSDMSSLGGILHTNSSLPDPFKKIAANSKHMRYNSFDDSAGGGSLADIASAVSSSNNNNNNSSGGGASSYDFPSGPGAAGRREGGLRSSAESDAGFTPSLPKATAATGGGSSKGVTYADEQQHQPSQGPGHNSSNSSNSSKKKTDDEEVDLGGFMPSFLEPNRQGRRRRSLDTSPLRSSDAGSGPGTFGGNNSDFYSNPPTYGTSVGGGGGGGVRSSVTSQLDELDIALGLAKTTASVSAGATSSGGAKTVSSVFSDTASGAGSVKKPVDPFSAVEAKVAAATRASTDYGNVNFDSSSDDDDDGYRLKSRQNKPAFGSFLSSNKGNTAATGAATSAAAGAKKASDSLPAAASSSAAAPAVVAHKPSDPAPSSTAPHAPVTSAATATASAAPAAPLSLNVPALERESSGLRPHLSRSPTAHGGAGNNNNNSATSAAAAHTSSHVSSLPSLTASASSAASLGSHLAPLELSMQEEDLDELDVSGIVRPSDGPLSAVTPGSTGKSPHHHRSSSSRPSSAGHKTSTPRRHSDGNNSNSLSSSVNLDDSTNSVSPHHSRGNSSGGSLKKSQSLKVSDAAASAGNSGGGGSSALANARGMLQRANTVGDVSSGGSGSNLLEINTQLNAATSAGPSSVNSLVVDRDAKDKLKQMQRVLDQTQQEKENSERSMRLEIEALKSRLANSATGTGAGAAGVGSSVTSLSGYKHFIHEDAANTANVKALYDEINEQRRTISALELEICRLKDEANIKAVKHHDDLRQLKDKYETELSELRLRSNIDLESVERRHADSVAALKKIHEDEIQMYKEKSRSNEVFSQIAASMKNTTGSIKHIEEQLYAKYRQVELQREGQIEAREKLLSEMEEKARERAELAEAEGYKLKGILSHMEAVVTSLRSQGGEEKERLKQEHQRLLALQAAVEHEKAALQARNTEELHYVKQRSKEVEIELNKLASEKQAHYEYVTSSQHKLDVERAEFASAMAQARRVNEARESDLLDAEVKLKRREEELLADRQAFETRRAGASRDLHAVEELKRSLQGEREQLDREREQLHGMASQVARVSEGLEQREEELQAHEAALEDREGALVEGFRHMKAAAAQLTQREMEIREALEVMDAKKISLDRMDREILDRKIAVTSAQREYLRGSLQGSGGSGGGNRSGGSGGPNGGAYLKLLAAAAAPSSSTANNDSDVTQEQKTSPTSAPSAVSGSSWLESFQQQMRHSYAAGLTSASLQHNLPLATTASAAGAAGGAPARSPLPKEIRVAQQTLQQSRNALSRVSASQINIQRSIQDENDFIHLLKKNQTASAAAAASRYAAL